MAIVKDLDLLSEKGKKVLDLKKVLLVNYGNELVYDGLFSSINEADYPKEVFKALGDLDCDEVQFQSILMSVEKYTNTKELKKQLEKVRIKLSDYLEKRKGQKHFSTENNVSNGSVSVIKRIGFNKEFIRREFRLTEQEANKLSKDGFLETYAKLKLNAIVKDMIEIVEKEHGKHDLIQLTISDFYHDKNTGYYNVNFVADVSITEKQLTNGSRSITAIAVYLDKILNGVTKTYQKAING